MKNILVFLSVILSGCGNCELLIGQIPPQFVSPIVGCTALLPDYKSKVTVTDNCAISSYVQTPAAGMMILNTTPVSVTLKATDISGNVKQIVFTVTLRDTIKPVFIVDPKLLASNWEVADSLYDQADKFLAQLLYFDTILPDQSYFIPEQVGTSYFYGIGRRVYPIYNYSTSNGVTTGSWDGVLQIDSAIYKTKRLVIKTPPYHAYNGIGKRMFIFE